MFKIFITKNQFNSLKNNVKFIDAIRLLRITNAIRASQSLIDRIIKDKSIRGQRDKFEVIQYYGAVVYEGIKTFFEMLDRLKILDEYKNNIHDINYLCREYKDKTSFTKTILARIRDKLVFHFDMDVFKKAILDMDLPSEEFIILEGDSKSNKDVNATSTTMLYFNYLISFVDQNISSEEKLEFIYDHLDLISNKLSNVVENIAYGLLKDIVDLKET